MGPSDVVDLALVATPHSYEPLVGWLPLEVDGVRSTVEITIRVDRDLDDGHDAIAAASWCPAIDVYGLGDW